MTQPSPEPDPADQLAALRADGVALVYGTMVNASGLTLAKSVPIGRTGAFQQSGMGTAPVWDVFTVNGGIAFTDTISAVGDRRLRIDLSALRRLGDAEAWAPADVRTLDGDATATCTRTVLAGLEQQLAGLGLDALVGHELEFVLVEPSGDALPGSAWVPYGLTGLQDRAAFFADVLAAAEIAGLELTQLHAEYGPHQFELSLAPASPVAAADQVVLAKILVGRAARRHGLAVSFSPAPFPGSVGNGAHHHLSLNRESRLLFSGGSGPHGITADGGAAIGGLLAGLTEVQGFLTGSVLSGARLAPGSWSGAFRCWGTENREAAVRFLPAGPGQPLGANVEVKCVDPSANVYLASAAVLALALDGIRRQMTLPAEMTEDPSRLTDEERAAAGLDVLPADPRVIVDTLARSTRARRLLGGHVVDTTVAVRRLEQVGFADHALDEVAAQLRLAWSI